MAIGEAMWSVGEKGSSGKPSCVANSTFQGVNEAKLGKLRAAGIWEAKLPGGHLSQQSRVMAGGSTDEGRPSGVDDGQRETERESERGEVRRGNGEVWVQRTLQKPPSIHKLL